jgi:hypothetical protein
LESISNSEGLPSWRFVGNSSRAPSIAAPLRRKIQGAWGGHARIPAGRTEVRRGASQHCGGSSPGWKTPVRGPSRCISLKLGDSLHLRGAGHAAHAIGGIAGRVSPRDKVCPARGQATPVAATRSRSLKVTEGSAASCASRNTNALAVGTEGGALTSVPLSSLGLGGVGDLGACPRFRKRPAVEQRERDGHDEE